MDLKVFIGVDVSKETLDFVPTIEGDTLFHEQVKNDKRYWSILQMAFQDSGIKS